MGKLDSSKTRVVPVFEALMAADSTGETWLAALLRMGSLSERCEVPAALGKLRTDHPRAWGHQERRLRPPTALLKWLVSNVPMAAIEKSEAAVERAKAAGKSSKAGGGALELRRLLAQQHQPIIDRALAALDSPDVRRGWHVLEGESSPDAFLETDRAIVVIEGKRTERSCTERTTWMGRRSQILRHMDAATEIAGDRRVFGMLLVEPCEGPEYEPSGFWKAEAAGQVDEELLSESLPHRTPEQRRNIAKGFVGVASWRAVCERFHIPWPIAE